VLAEYETRRRAEKAHHQSTLRGKPVCSKEDESLIPLLCELDNELLLVFQHIFCIVQFHQRFMRLVFLLQDLPILALEEGAKPVTLTFEQTVLHTIDSGANILWPEFVGGGVEVVELLNELVIGEWWEWWEWWKCFLIEAWWRGGTILADGDDWDGDRSAISLSELD
jgi:hypothetical protein